MEIFNENWGAGRAGDERAKIGKKNLGPVYMEGGCPG